MSENNQLPQDEQKKAQAEEAAGQSGFMAFWKRPIKVPEGKKPRTMGQEILSWIYTIATALAIVLVVRTFVFELYKVDGASMSNTLVDGERMFCTKFDYLTNGPQRGDVVICHFPNRGRTAFVKRLVAMPGDTVEIKNRQLYVNDELVPDPPKMYLMPNSDYPRRTLQENEYFVVGDNRGNSHDSRAGDVGPLTRDQIVAHVRTVIFPFSSFRTVE